MKQSIFFIILFCSLSLNAMKRAYPYGSKHDYKQPKKMVKKRIVPFDGPSLPRELQETIVTFLTTDTREHLCRDACSTVTALARVNRALHLKINNRPFLNELIEKYAQKFRCTNETITRFLSDIAEAKNIYRIQLQLKYLSYDHDNDYYEKRLQDLTNQGANLTFTYNFYGRAFTKFMITLSDEYLPTPTDFLIKAGADVNGKNIHGQTALHILLQPQFNRISNIEYLYSRPDIRLNQQDNSGRTPLLYVIYKYGYTLPRYTLQQAKRLLKAKADPEIADKRGLTPLIAAKAAGYLGLIELIDAAILKKKSL
jgi:ankyrin repeat protein